MLKRKLAWIGMIAWTISMICWVLSGGPPLGKIFAASLYICVMVNSIDKLITEYRNANTTSPTEEPTEPQIEEVEEIKEEEPIDPINDRSEILDL